MTEYIELLGVLSGTKEDGSVMQLDDAVNVCNLLARDATYGTFGEFTAGFWKSRLSRDIDALALMDRVSQTSTSSDFTFRLRIDASLFNPSHGGFQHLIGVLAGDLPILQVRGLKLRPIRIDNVSFPPSWQESARALYRDNSAHTIDEIRAAFELDKDEPLLAFSLKPRMGLTADAMSEIALGVLAEGFNIVELDTRNLDLADKTLDSLLELSRNAIDVGNQKRVTSFSINLSVPAQMAVDVCGKFAGALPAPYVVKVDGGLDGVSTCQALRTACKKDLGRDSPFITTYPLLRSVIKERIADDTFLNALIWSGSDIIYPGNAPNLGGYRQLDHSAVGSITSSVDRYWRFVSEGYPMPTVAGGIYPGQLQAYYELLGPKVAYFIGGGVALHNEGPVKGAALCKRILDEARELREKAGATQFADEIKSSLQQKVEESMAIPAGADAATFRYFPPSELAQIPALRPWFKR